MNIEVKSTHDAQDDPRNDDILIWVNGELIRKDDAKVSVYNSVFMLGDGMWEGMRLHKGVWAFFDEHMDWLRCRRCVDFRPARTQNLTAIPS